MGFSRIVGIGTSLIWNLSLTSWPLTMEMLRDFSGLISIHTHLMLPWSLPSRHLVHALVDIIVVMSSIKRPDRGKHSLLFRCTPPATHHETRIISSIAMVKASGEMVQPAIMPIPRHCQTVVLSWSVTQNWRSWQLAFTSLVMVSGTWKNIYCIDLTGSP